MASEDLLDTLLSTAIGEFGGECNPQKTLKEADIFSKECNTIVSRTENSDKKLSIIHSGDTDSSDDEDNKYYEERKYNECGKNVKHLLQATNSSKEAPGHSSSTWKTKPTVHELAVKTTIIHKTLDVYTDPIFGLRIINPLVSSASLKEKMTGREAVSFARIKKFVTGNISDKNWVIAGVIANKSAVRTSQKGNQFLIWTLTDLKDDIKTVSVFLFGSAYKQLWKTASGVVLGILNPSVLDKKDGSKDEACLSVDNAQKVMILGQSKDLGTCKSVKKNGERCTAIVNVNRCEYCIYHVKQEYQKCSRRSELQSNFTGKGLTALRNKVLGKNEVFYAGKSYMAIPAKRSKKLQEKDTGRLQSLSGATAKAVAPLRERNPRKKKQAAANLEISHRQRIRDLALLEKLGGEGAKTDFKASHSAEVSLESSKSNALSIIAKLKAKNEQKKNEIVALKTPLPIEKSNNVLQLKMINKEGVVDLNTTATPQQINRAKFNAVKYVKEHGSLKKSDPNSVKKLPSESKKRPIHASEEERNPKKLKILENEFLSDRFKKMMETTSKHLDLLDDRDNEEQEKYFHKLEMKEKMEEKMVNTYKVPCKAVRCLKCKYTNFSSSQFCKDEKHPLKVFDAFKRFYKCGNCGNRTVSLDVVPVTACNNCGSGKWERTGMIKEKTATITHNLSIRGGEQKFINSVTTNSNLDLLVPD